MKRRCALSTALAAGGLAAAGLPLAARAQGAASNVLRIVPQANLVLLDPVQTTAYNTRNHGYMIYDTLFGTDATGQVQPQMVDKWSVTADQKSWTLRLRDALEFHDGTPVTSADVIASLTRWSGRDAMGGALARFLDAYEALDARTVRIRLNAPFGSLLEALGKPSSNVPFIMPARIAATPDTGQIKEHIGSGPYIFVPGEFRPGTRVVYIRNPKYRARAEPPSGTAGGKNVYVDRVEWVIIRDPQTQLSALLAGEVDIIEQPQAEQYPSIRAAPGVSLVDAQPDGFQYVLRMNFLHAPFDDVRVRRAAMLALGQEQILRTQVGTPGMYRFCKSLFPCGTPLESQSSGIFRAVADPQAARKLLQQAGYQGEPVLLMRPTDLASLSKAPLVAKQQLEQGGFVVNLQSMDWPTLLARRNNKAPPGQGGWNAFITFIAAADLLNPLTMATMNATGAKGWFGWQDDPELEKIKLDFAKAGTQAEKKRLAAVAQLRAIDQVSHVNLGQFSAPAAVRNTVSGIVPGGAQVYWNIRKSG